MEDQAVVVVVEEDLRSIENITALHDAQDLLAKGVLRIINGLQWTTAQQAGHQLTRNGKTRTNNVDGLVQDCLIVDIAMLTWIPVCLLRITSYITIHFVDFPLQKPSLDVGAL